ncbi:MAG: sigma-70 family RNA polymerase sigma factor [Ruminiclostridium sp.]|nr:sigma-70 family RNA polymerase sigma factor [Ruminiclostridium sp.]
MLCFYLSMIDTEEEKSSFEELYIKHRQVMYTAAVKILRKPEDAEDAVHQAFIKIAENFKRISEIPQDRVRGYVIMIARNTAIDMQRKKKKFTASKVDIEKCSVSFDAEYFEAFEQKVLVEAIRSLPKIYRDVVYLFYLEDFKVKEIAVMLSIKEKTVTKRLQRARQMLRKYLEENDYERKQMEEITY